MKIRSGNVGERRRKDEDCPCKSEVVILPKLKECSKK